MGNFLILMSGGTTPVINSTLVGILKVLKKKRIKVFSGMPGLDGVLNGKFIDLSNLSHTKIKLIGDTPGSHFTGTSRLKKLTTSEILKLKSIFLKKKNFLCSQYWWKWNLVTINRSIFKITKGKFHILSKNC